MLYYGDLFIRGEDKMKALAPGCDLIGKGFAFHNSFNYLYPKLSSEIAYPLREFDMYTLFDLLNARLEKEYLDAHTNVVTTPNTFFFREEYAQRR